MQSIEPHDQVKLAPPPLSASGATLLQDVSNSTLIAELCRARAKISIALDGGTVLLAECLVPLERLWPCNCLSDSILVQTVPVDSNIHQFAVLNTALIRDCLVAGGAERLAEACNREPWLVTLAEVGWWFDLSHKSLARGFWRPKWQLLAGSQDGQLERLLSSMLHCIRPRRNTRLYDSPRFLHPCKWANRSRTV